MTEPSLSRRRLLRSGAAAGTLLLAGCGGTGSTGTPTGTSTGTATGTAGTTGTASPTEEPTPTARPTAVIGEAVGGDGLSMVLLGARRRESVAGRTASDGNTMVVAFFQLQNRLSDRFLSMRNVGPFELTAESGTYSRVLVSDEPGSLFRNGLVAPGEVLQGYVAFEAPADVARPAVEVDVDSEHTVVERATFRLDRQAETATRLEQDLRVPVADVGERVTSGDLSVTVADFRTTDSVGSVRSTENTTFAIPTVTIENSADESQLVVLPGQALLKNGTGQVYATSVETQFSLDDALNWNTTVPATGRVSGEVPYNAGVDVSPLYFVFDFAAVNGGDRYFWQVA